MPEYRIELGDIRVARSIPETNREEFDLTQDERKLVDRFGLTFSQVRWRRWMIFMMESLRRSGETRFLFQQEFAEDDVSCFVATGDMYFDQQTVDTMARSCYPAPHSMDSLKIWYPPEKDMDYIVSVDPGQAKITQSAITVIGFKRNELGNTIPYLCARDAGLYPPELTSNKAIAASNLYGRCMITWEANSHGLAITERLKLRRPIYFRKDITSGRQSMEIGWMTTSKTKDYMLHVMARYLPDLVCHDSEVVQQLRNHRLNGDKVEVVGANDIFMALAIGLVCFNPIKPQVGFAGTTGWKW